MSEPADLWTLSRTGDPWVVLDRLILCGHVVALRSWFQDPDSKPLCFGGHHYTVGLPIWDAPLQADVVSPNEGNFVTHVETLLRAPMARLSTHLRDQFRGCSTAEEAKDLAARVLMQLAEFQSSARLFEPEDGRAQILDALGDLESLVDARLAHWSTGIHDLKPRGKKEPTASWSAVREGDGRFTYTQEQKEWVASTWLSIKSSQTASDKSLFERTFSPAYKKRFPGGPIPDQKSVRNWAEKSTR